MNGKRMVASLFDDVAEDLDELMIRCGRVKTQGAVILNVELPAIYNLWVRCAILFYLFFLHVT